jgi:hypothetical protein
VPLPGTRGNLAHPDGQWVDAQRYALKQGQVQVQVLSAAVRPSKPTSAKNVTPKLALFVSLRSQQPGTAGEFTSKPMPASSPGFGAAGPRLTDRRGKGYALQEVQEVETAKSPRKSRMFPAAIQEHLFVFEAPPPEVECLRLEVPAAAWGGIGDFCFEIPKFMISYSQANTAGPAGGR